MIRYLFGLLIAAVLVLSAQAEVVDVGNEELQELLDRGVALIDVRTAGEWRETGVIEGSHLLTFFDEQGRFDAAAWLAELERIAGPDQPVALICATGGRTTAISFFLDRQAGYEKVYHASEGVIGWLQQYRPTVPVTAAVADRHPQRPCAPEGADEAAGQC